MKISWTRAAVRQLAAACDCIGGDRVDAADRLQLRVLDQVKHLAEFPQTGRPGRVSGTRELVIVGTPYIVAYRIKVSIQILAVLHAKRR